MHVIILTHIPAQHSGLLSRRRTPLKQQLEGDKEKGPARHRGDSAGPDTLTGPRGGIRTRKRLPN